ncbi:MAG: methyltransferase, partial [Odoribacter sp.]|nr:methyltransferase [Odoribacter sp.]
VFIDADKRQYLDYYRLVFDRVRSGGLIVADDVLWDGKVVDARSRDAQTRGILEFNDFVQSDSRVENILLPVRHGLMLIRKK